MAYVELAYIKKVLRDDLLTYPSDITDYLDFAETEINGQLVGQFAIPFDNVALYAEVPSLIKWIAAYLVGYKIYAERTGTMNIEDTNGHRWWIMAQTWLQGIVDGKYDLILSDGTVVEETGSTSAPRSYPTGAKDKAPSADNVPYFTRAQAGEW